ncbi:hypothetical protein, partial [Caldisphaera sp.]|uniref:hypothetical protein n=1 Tax=Caldisphaera sp. TaxID=2060322 RepID=UPI003D0CD1DE
MQLTVLGIIIAAYITKFPKKLQLIFNVSNIPLMILNILGIGFSYPAWAISINNAIQGVWASLNFHEFISNSQPLGFTRVTG